MNKKHILAEIRRTAGENQGRPLGIKRFSDVTGIREADWLGKHWARWSDAVREAGFEPNALQGAFAEDVLLEQYAQLVRELGHVPVKAELQMQHHQDPSFPDVNVFIRRFGGLRKAAVPKLVAYCQRSPSYHDVLAICTAWQESQPSAHEKPSREKAVVLGYVYLLRSGRHYKIGRTNAVGRRERELAIQLPQKGEVLHKIATDDPAGIEAYWHRRFDAKRGNGEWFNLSQEDIAAFRRRKSM